MKKDITGLIKLLSNLQTILGTWLETSKLLNFQNVKTSFIKGLNSIIEVVSVSQVQKDAKMKKSIGDRECILKVSCDDHTNLVY